MHFYNQSKLKKYQKNTLKIIRDDFLNNINDKDKERRVVISPTGSGKTFMMFAFIESIIDIDKTDKYRFLLITHSLQMAKGFKEDINKIGSSVYTFEDLENKISRINDKIILLNPEKINTNNGKDYLNRWKKLNEDKKVLLIMDEVDVTHDGKRNKNLLEIIRPQYELGFTATFDIKKDISKSKKSERKPSKVIHEVPLSEVKKEEVIVKGFESISDTEGVSFESIIKTALEKQIEIYNKTKYINDSYIPRILIQTNASRTIEIKDIVLNEVSKLNNQLYKSSNLKIAGIITAELKEFNEEDKSNYLIIIGDGIVSRGWDYPEIKIIVTDKNSVDTSVGLQLLGRASRMPDQYYRQNDLLNNGYIYIAGKHSIEKSGEVYSKGIIFNQDASIIPPVEKEEINTKDLKVPIFKTWINDFEDDFYLKHEEEYEELIDRLITIIIDFISNSKIKNTYKKEVKRFDFENASESLCFVDLEIDYNYALNEVKKALSKKIPESLVNDAFSDSKLRDDSIKYEKIYESLIVLIEKDSNEYLINLIKKIKYKSIPFVFNKRSIIKNQSIKYSRSLYELDDSMNEEEKSFAALLNEYCNENNKYWIRNKERLDIRLPCGYYPDFIVFDSQEYFMIEYKGSHIKDSDNSIKKMNYGLNNEITPILMVIKEDGFKVATADHSFYDWNSNKVNSIVKLAKK